MMTESQQSFLTESRKWMALALLLLAGWILYLLAPVLSPFVMGAVLAYLGDPLVDRLEVRKVPRTLGVVIVFVIFSAFAVLALLLLIPLIQKQLVIVYQSIPGFLEWLNTSAIPWMKERTGLSLEILEPGVLLASLEEHLKTAGSIAADILAGVGSSGKALALWISNLVLIPVVAFYLMRDWDDLVEENVQEMFPRNKVGTVSRLAREMDEVLGAFLRGQLLVMLALGGIYSIGLWVIGLNVALIIGMVAGLASIVPYLGFIVGIAAAIIAGVLQFGDFSLLIYIFIVFGVGQTLESVALTPLLVGDKIGLHPVAVIFAIMAGGQLFGFTGILVALPVAAVIMVLLRHMHQRYKSSDVYSADSLLTEPDESSADSLVEESSADSLVNKEVETIKGSADSLLSEPDQELKKQE